MEAIEFDRMFDFEDGHWWFVGQRTVVLDAVEGLVRGGPAGELLDVGCGTGGFAALAAERFGEPWCVDPSARALRYCRRRGLSRCVRASAARLPFADASFVGLTALDVIEHIEDDRGAVREFARVLAPGGWLFVTVPAWPALWSEHDEALHHVRRYTPRRLRQALDVPGLQLERLTFFQSVLAGPAAAARLLGRLRRRRSGAATSDLRRVHPVLNAALAAAFGAERFALRRVDLPVGISLLAVARRVAAP